MTNLTAESKAENLIKIKAAWENGENSEELKKEFGNDYDSYSAYFENDEKFLATGEIKPKW